MNKINTFLKWFNHPAQILESFGYITVIIGALVSLSGVSRWFDTIGKTVHGTDPFIIVLGGVLISLIGSQGFFAMARIVKAADKYLKDNQPK